MLSLSITIQTKKEFDVRIRFDGRELHMEDLNEELAGDILIHHILVTDNDSPEALSACLTRGDVSSKVLCK
jgi:hypothetical protein